MGKLTTAIAALFLVLILAASQPASAQEKKPNILIIMGDDIGWMQPSIYHRGLMVGETPNIDRIAHDGALFRELNGWIVISMKNDWKHTFAFNK